MHDRLGVRSIRWPAPGRTELVELKPARPEPDMVAVSISVSVTSPGTERARYLGLPTASVDFPHAPGSLAAGICDGDRVAVRNVPHQAEVCVSPAALHPVPPGAALIDAALWQLTLTAMHGLAVGGYRKGEPVAVLGAGLLGALTRRIAAARGSQCLAVATSEARRWTIRAEPTTAFALAGQPPPERYRLVLDVTGAADGLAAATRFAADGGHIVLLGSPRAAVAPLPALDIQQRGLSVQGAHVRTLDDAGPHTAEFFALLEQGRFSCRDLLPTYAPERAPEVYRRLVHDRAFVGAAFAWGATRPRTTSRKPVRFALLGCGDVGIRDAAATATAAKLVACFDPVRELAVEVADRFGGVATHDAEQLLSRPDVDAVIVATPHDTHEDLAVQALSAGKHVLLEKPLAVDLPAAARIAAAAARNDRTVGVLFHLRGDNRFRRAVDAIRAGRLGTPLAALATYLIDKPPSYYGGGYSNRAPSEWRLSPTRSGGGFLVMNVIHHLDAVRSLLGTDADTVFAATAAGADAPDLDDVVSMVVRFGPVVATFAGAASAVRRSGEHLRIWGTAGNVDVLPHAVVTGRDGLPERLDKGLDGGTDIDPRTAVIADFAAAVRTGRPPAVPVEDALMVQAMVEAAYRSARTGVAESPAALLAEVAGGLR